MLPTIDPDVSDPVAARALIAALAERVRALQQSADALRVDNALLKRAGSGGISQDYVQRLKTDLRDLRTFARKRGLDLETIALLAGSGEGLHIPAPAAMDQTLTIIMPPDRSVRDLRPLTMTPMRRLGSALVLTSAFRLVQLNGLSLAMSEGMDWGDAQGGGALGLARGERIEAACPIDEFDPPHSVAIVTRRGWCRVMPWSVVESLYTSGLPISPYDANDAPAWIAPWNGGDLLLVTRLGRWVRLPAGVLEPAGQEAIVLEQDDDVACGCVIADDTQIVHFVGADGAQFAVAAAGLPAHKKTGVKTQPLRRDWVALLCGIATRTDAVVMLTMGGELIVSALRGLRAAERPSEARPLNVAGQRLAAACILGQ